MASYLRILHQECDREMRLINDLLDLQHLEADILPLDLVTIQLQHWLPHLIEPFEQRIQNSQQRLVIQIPETTPPLISDRVSLERVITEVLYNAWKYTPAEGIITLNVLVEPDELQLQISNSGVQIPADKLTRIFDKFYRIPDIDPWKHGGTGLGLALVKKLVEHLGGRIQTTSDPQKTCFTLILPRQPPSKKLL
ncbi:sensor histidine kinase [Neosynechococcus sphagnicola]|uniref:sensor histidine kinase n=1 Tax=Neosynechococcus sphagnicola TaxID=1501145 RepID=UPI0009DCD189|nr:HAMP domain-containing sensor histidine kinase [Neosynechococcus sphagnicola]